MAVWFAALVLFGIAEAATVSLVSIWFMAGALVALVAAICGAPIWLQVLLFLAVSVALLASLRSLVRKFVTPKLTRTNVESLIGKAAVVTENIDNISAQGSAKVGGVVWTARSTDGCPIPAGARVIVDRIEGVKVFVSPAEVTAK